MHFGILIHMLHALQHGTVNPNLANLKTIVIMNQKLEHVIVFIREVKLTRLSKLFLFLVLELKIVSRTNIGLISVKTGHVEKVYVTRFTSFNYLSNQSFR